MPRFLGIDPSSKTGFVILNTDGNYIDGFEIESKAKTKTEQIDDIVTEIMDNLEDGDVISIEGFSFGSKGQGVDFQYGLGHAIRLELFREGIKWIEATPSQVKKYATGKGNTSKENMIIPIYEEWNFKSDSNNVRDAFLLAHIARSVRMGTARLKYQREVVEAILAPPAAKKKKA